MNAVAYEFPYALRLLGGRGLTFDMPASIDMSNHGGIFTADGQPKVYADLVTKLNGRQQVGARVTIALLYLLVSFYTCRSYQDRMWDEVRAVDMAGGTPDVRFTVRMNQCTLTEAN